jgi:Mg2+-importing ATPase
VTPVTRHSDVRCIRAHIEDANLKGSSCSVTRGALRGIARHLGSASSTVSETAPDAASRLEGLTQREAEERLRQVGPNDPSPRKRGALLIELFVLFLNPLVIILLIAVLISVVVGQVTDATIIFVIAILSVVINFIQTYRSERSIKVVAHAACPVLTVRG